MTADLLRGRRGAPEGDGRRDHALEAVVDRGLLVGRLLARFYRVLERNARRRDVHYPPGEPEERGDGDDGHAVLARLQRHVGQVRRGGRALRLHGQAGRDRVIDERGVPVEAFWGPFVDNGAGQAGVQAEEAQRQSVDAGHSE